MPDVREFWDPIEEETPSVDVRDFWDPVPGEESSPTLDVRHFFEPQNNPESLFNLAKANPREAASFTDDQVDQVIDHMLQKGLDVTEIPGSAAQAFGQAVVDVTSGIGAGIADYIAGGGDIVTPTLRQLGSVAEGGLRGAADLGILGRQAAFRSRLSPITKIDTSRPGVFRGHGRPMFDTIEVPYSEFPEEEKASIREDFRFLQKALADRADGIEEGESYLADIATAITGNTEFGDSVARMVIPESAEAYSYFLGPEGVAAGGVRKIALKAGVDMTQGTLGKNLVMEAEKGALKAGEKAAEGLSNMVDFGRRKVEEVAEEVNASVKDVASRANGLSKAFQTGAETLRAFREQYGNSTGQTALARIARDANSPEYLQKFATMLTHSSRYASLLGPGVALASSPLTAILRASRSGARAGASGAILAMPTWDGETIGGAIGSAMAIGGATDAVGRVDFGNRQRINQRAQKWLLNQPVFVQDAFNSRFSNDQIARLPIFVEMVNGVLRGSNAQYDAEVYWTNAQNFSQDLATLKGQFDIAYEQGSPLDAQNHLERQRKNTEADALASPTRGVQLLANRAKGLKPVLLINVDTATPSTIIHEGIHAMSRVGDFNGEFGNLREVLFDQKHEDGTEISNGMISDTDVASSYENYLKQLPEDQRAIMAEQLDTPRKRLAYMKEEILADSVEAFVMDRAPLYVDDMTGFVHAGLEPLSRRLGITAEFLAGTRPTRGYLTQHPEWNRSGLDPRYYKSPEFDSAVSNLLRAARKIEFHRDGDARRGIRKGSRVRRTLKDDQDFVTIKPKTIKRGTKLARQFEGSILFDGYDGDGNLKLINDIKSLKAKEKERAQVLKGLFIAQGAEAVAYPDAHPGKVPAHIDAETGEVVGDYIGQNIMAQLEIQTKEGRFPAPLFEHLGVMNEAARRGRMLEIDYNPRLNRHRKYDSRLSSTLRIVLPYSFRITRAGNFTFNTLDMGHLAEKFERKKKQNRIARLWNGDWDAFSADLAKYVQNTIESPTNLAVNGISREKANVLSAFLGFRVRRGQPLMNNAAGRQAELFNEVNTDGHSDNLIRTRRVDAINSVKPAGQFEVFPLTPSGRESIQQNFEPGGGVDRSMEGGEHLISQRLPLKAGKPTSAHTESHLVIGIDQILELNDSQKKDALRLLREIPFAPKGLRSLPRALSELRAVMVDNLLWLHDEYEKAFPGINKRAKLWYDGARKISDTMATEYGVPVQSVAGVLAALSPGKDWFMNVSIGDRLINIYTKKQDAKVSPEMLEWMQGKGVTPEDMAAMNGVRMGDLPIDLQAIFIRSFDEVYHDGSFFVITPEGGVSGRKKNKDGTLGVRVWQSYPNIEKAISVLRDPSFENISAAMGAAHKVRDFFNNIISPNALDGSVTIDTHATAAALLLALAQKDSFSSQAMGGSGPASAASGSKGFYGFYADVYRQAAKMRGILPREMQSITWEAGRGLFSAEFKRGKDPESGLQNKLILEQIWGKVKSGEITHEEARRQINHKAGGIEAPEWFTVDSEDDPGQRATYTPGIF